MEMSWGEAGGTGNRGTDGWGCEAERGEWGTGVRDMVSGGGVD